MVYLQADKKELVCFPCTRLISEIQAGLSKGFAGTQHDFC